MPPKTETPTIFIRILDRYGMPSAFLAIVIAGYYMLYNDNRAQSERVISAFVRQAEVSQRMANSIDALTAEIRGRK